MIENIRGGNILLAETDALVNPVNCVGTMGKGLALQFKKAFPEMAAEYTRHCKDGNMVIGRMDIRDEEINELRTKVEHLQQRLDGSASGWCLPRYERDEGKLPIPRLEFEWFPGAAGWMSYTVEYRMVMHHLIGDKTVTVPLNTTVVRSSGYDDAPYSSASLNDWLPTGDGAHAKHDSQHLRMPLYAVTPNSHVRIPVHGPSASKGFMNRREIE